MELLVLGIILIVNLVWAGVWYFRKTQTFEFKVNRFIQKEKLKPKKEIKLVSEDALVQMFLRSGHENLRVFLKDIFNLNTFFNIISQKLNKDPENKFIVNAKSKFFLRKDPTAPPIKKDPDLIIL